MISTIRIFFIITALALSSCVKNKFTIDFSLPESVNTNYTVSYYASDPRGGITVETVAPIVKGKGVLKGIARNPSLVYIRNNAGAGIALYVERGDNVKISGQNPNPASWSVEGNTLNEQWSAWRNQNQAVLEKKDPVEINAAVARYVMENPASPVSTLLLLTSFSRISDEALFRSLWLRLEGDATLRKWTALSGRADQPDQFVATPAKLKSMAVRSFANGVDTIRTDASKATIIFFWHSGLDSRNEAIDSLKALTREFPDSSKRVIADICLEADSLSWKSPLRRDSLTKAVRGWLPAGLADSKVMALEVKRTPFFIVFSPDGNQRYRGDDLGKASAEFRRLMK